MHHRAAAQAAIGFLRDFQSGNVTTTQSESLAKAVNLTLRTVCLDALAASPPTDAEAIREWINQKIDVTVMIDELPLGPDEATVSENDIAVVRKLLDDLAVRINLAEAKAKKRGRPPKAGAVEKSE